MRSGSTGGCGGNLGKISQDWNSTVTGSGDELEVVFNPNAALTGGGIRAIRRTGVHLPDGTTVSYTFGSTGGRHDAEVSRVTNVMVGMTVVASYEYLGLAQVAGTELPEPELLYNRFAPGAASGAYARLDRFDRVTSDIWTRGIDTDSNGSYDVYRDFYEQTIGWSETSNIDQVEDEVYPNWDVAYTNDGLERLTRALRSDAINGNVFDEQWSLSQTGNWEHYILDRNANGTYTDSGDLNDDQTFNTVNELTGRNTDSSGGDEFTLLYDEMGNLTDDGEDYEYVYDVWGRLREVRDTSDQGLVAEYTYNGLGHRIGWHYDVTDDGTNGTPDGVVDANDPWFHFVYDDRWRIVATYRADHAGGGGGWTIDDDPKERFVYHNAGLDGYGSSSYIDAVVLRERDADTGWPDEAEGTLEERTYYLQNWRADVVALMTDAGQLIQQVRYDPYGVPFGLSKADVNGDGAVNTSDVTAYGNIWNGGNGTHPYADWNFDGAVNTSDYIGFLNSRANDAALGRGKLGYAFAHVGGNNRKAYAGYEEANELDVEKPGAYHVRRRVYIAGLGRWSRRDPVGYIGPHGLYLMSAINPTLVTDPSGLAYASGGGTGCGTTCGRGETTPLASPDEPLGTEPPSDPAKHPRICCGPTETSLDPFTHCEFSWGPCAAGEREYQVWRDLNTPGRTLPDGTPCSQATPTQIAECLGGVGCHTNWPYPTCPYGPGNNCQEDVANRLRSCCLLTSWNPSLHAFTTSTCIEWKTVYLRPPTFQEDPEPVPVRTCVKWATGHDAPCIRWVQVRTVCSAGTGAPGQICIENRCVAWGTPGGPDLGLPNDPFPRTRPPKSPRSPGWELP